MKMLGKTNAPPCGSNCCGVPPKARKADKRAVKRRERAEWKKEIR